ncbi:uncharacterized protein MYCFIDRAFT_210887 [Pseudocercospora fijiensis CIRAD86]|uniref:Uncharacterized protein n=1 Tax=Pseudocercospora fijiensis (strain CIRAD86) TaxID=383855 RepID=M3AIP4_PSEFD|nr:uncharacterized protein MYCFIDRAFT_210887 [Pseudocercospora fijiensis CIRAD86]EME84466.1 hypothetical protein MYCFIDRAFT_210887 [Pseudocercospora fijiensis CIRAD86]
MNGPSSNPEEHGMILSGRVNSVVSVTLSSATPKLCETAAAPNLESSGRDFVVKAVGLI